MAKIIIRSGKIALVVMVVMAVLVLSAYAWRAMAAAGIQSEEDNTQLVASDKRTDLPVPIKREIVDDRDENTRLWEITKWQKEIDPVTGEVNTVEVKSIVREKGCGICYKDANDSWQVTDTSWKQTANGFVMDKANYALEMGKTADSVLYYDIDGENLALKADSIKIYDGSNILPFASVNSTEGYIDPNDSTKLIYPNAYGKGIDLEIQAQPDGFHQNVIFKNKPALPKGVKNNAKVFLYTELGLDNYLDNSKRKDYSVQMLSDGTEKGQKKQKKIGKNDISGLNIDKFSKSKINFAIEENGQSFTSHSFVDSKILHDGHKELAAAEKQIIRGSDNKTYLVESLDCSKMDEASYPVVWDYHNVSGTITQNETWFADATYYISSTITLDPNVTLKIEPGTIIKIRAGFYNYIDAWSGTLIAKGEPYSYIVFTSARDPNMGEIIDTATVGIGDWEGIYFNANSNVEFCKVGYSNFGIYAYAAQPGNIIIRNNIIYNSGYYGITASSSEYARGNLVISNNLVDNVLYYTGIYADYYYPTVVSDVNIIITNNTIKATKYQYGGEGIFVYNGGNQPAVVKNNIIQGALTGIHLAEYASGPYSEHNNAFYQCTYNVQGATESAADKNLTVSPFDSANTYLGKYFLNNDPCGGNLLKDAGDASVRNYYDEPNDWSIYAVSDANHLFTTTTIFSIGKIWQPNFETCDTGTVAIGYHHPRVDYVCAATVQVNQFFEIEPRTIISFDGYSSSTTPCRFDIYGTFNCKGTASEQIQIMTNGCISTNWITYKQRDHKNGGITLNSSGNIYFTKFNNIANLLTYGPNLKIHDCVFRSCYQGVYWHHGSGHIVSNCLFMENDCGITAFHSSTAGWQVLNSTFDRNTHAGIYSYQQGIVKNCHFTNSVTSNPNNLPMAGCGIFESISSSTAPPRIVESYNSFYNNDRHYIFYRSIGGTYTTRQLSSTDKAGLPAWQNASVLNSDPLFAGWNDNFYNRFYLLQDSALVDGGDPADEPMWGYTTDPTAITNPENAIVDTNRRDIGYHYPTDTQSDSDGLYDYEEYWLGTSPTSNDSDSDGLSDYAEVKTYGTNPLDSDTDNDSMPDRWEITHGLNPLISNATSDQDNDNVTNLEEYLYNIDPNGSNIGQQWSDYEYNNAGQIVTEWAFQVTSSHFYITQTKYEYDSLGRKTLERRVANPGLLATQGIDNNNDQITLYTYDTVGNLKKTIRKGIGCTSINTIEVNDVVTENSYDALGRITTVTDALGYVTQYEYQNDQLYSVTDANGNTTTNYYDTAGRTVKIVNALGHYRVISYDSLGRTIKEISYDCNGTANAESDDFALTQNRFVYDNLNHIIRRATMVTASSIAAIDPNYDMVFDYAYDGQGGSYPGLLVSQTLYFNGSGTNLRSATTTYEYDDLGRQVKTTDPNNNTVELAYDSSDRVVQRKQTDINPLGGSNIVMTTAYEYDSLGQLAAEVAKENVNVTSTWQQTQYQYVFGNRVMAIAPDSKVTVFTYNNFGQMTAKIDDYGVSNLNQTTEYDYDRLGRQTAIVGYASAATPQITTYTYDKLNRTTKVTYPDGSNIQYSYNELGQVLQRIDQRNITTNYVYDDLQRLIKKRINSGGFDVNEIFSYDGLNRLQTARKIENGSTISNSTFTYNSFGKVASASDSILGGAPRQTLYSYNQAGYKKWSSLPNGGNLYITPRWDGKISSTNYVFIKAYYQYIGSRVAERKNVTANINVADVNTAYTYDNLGRVTEIHSVRGPNTLVDFAYSYEPNSNNISNIAYNHRPAVFSNGFDYDNLNRLTQADYGLDSTNEVFTMDDLGNRSNVNLRSGTNQAYTVDNLTNKYTSISSISQTYDNAGNLTADYRGYSYTYDYENRLTKVSNSSIDLVTFAYDAIGRRIVKNDLVDSNNSRRYYYNDNWQVTCEYNASETVTTIFAYGNYIDEVIGKLDGGTSIVFYLYDHLYSPVALCNSITGQVYERYEYDAYGKPTIYNADFTATRTASSYKNPYMFTGRNVDYIDGGNLKLQYNRNRYYDYDMGRWLTQDPLGIVPNEAYTFRPLNEYKDTMNLLEYVRSNTISFLDPYGLLCSCYGGGIKTISLGFSKGFGPICASVMGDGSGEIKICQKCCKDNRLISDESVSLNGKITATVSGSPWGFHQDMSFGKGLAYAEGWVGVNVSVNFSGTASGELTTDRCNNMENVGKVCFSGSGTLTIEVGGWLDVKAGALFLHTGAKGSGSGGVSVSKCYVCNGKTCEWEKGKFCINGSVDVDVSIIWVGAAINVWSGSKCWEM